MARRLGARGSLPLLAIVVCGLICRFRSQLRPESLASILLIAELLILETRRSGGRDRAWWIVPIACLWENVHISFYLCPLILLLYAIPEGLARRRPGRSGRAATRGLLPVLLVSIAACFVNPFGFRAVVQPFEYFFVWRHEPIFRTIAELHGIDWSFNARNGLIACMVLWPLLQLARWRARRGDPVEFLLWALVTSTALMSQRFTSTWAIVAAPFLGRDLAWWKERAWPKGLRLGPAVAPALVAVACVAVCIPEWSRREMQPGVGLDPLAAPDAACTFIEREGLRGRFFNHFELSGLMLWRFWPQQDRLPFMDIHQSGTARERLNYVACMSNEAAWRQMAEAYRFDVAILRRVHARGDRLLDFLDADSTWSMVFVDDVAAIYVRRGGPYAALVREQGYRVLPGGKAKLAALEGRSDSTLRAVFRRELLRSAGESAASSTALSLLASLDLLEARPDSARVHLGAAHAIDPLLLYYHYRLAAAERAEGHLARAVELFQRARRSGEVAAVDAETAPLLERLGRRSEANQAYRRALRANPANAEIEAGIARTAAGR